MADNELILKTLMEIQNKLGVLQQDSESSQRQRAVLFDKTDGLVKLMAGFDAKFNAHTAKFDDHVEKEENIFKQVEEHEKVLSPFRDIKTKGLGILAIIALTGGTLGSQAEKLFMAIIGK